MNQLERRIIDLSYKHKASHIGSCLSAVNIINNIYKVKKPTDPFILSNGHTGLALYVVLESLGLVDADDLFNRHGVHPNRNLKDHLIVSSGSLGQGLPIAVGMAVANRDQTVYVLTSDGEMAEGSMWEALKIAADLRLENLRIAVVGNGYSAYDKTDVDTIDTRMQYFYPSLMVKTNLYQMPPWLQGLQAHYHVMTDDEYEEITTKY